MQSNGNQPSLPLQSGMGNFNDLQQSELISLYLYYTKALENFDRKEASAQLRGAYVRRCHASERQAVKLAWPHRPPRRASGNTIRSYELRQTNCGLDLR